jgi:hypothetical protein
MDDYRPSLTRLILADYTSYQAALLTGILWIIFFLDLIYQAVPAVFSYLVLGVSLVSVSILLIRYRRLLTMFAADIEAPGVIQEVATFRGRVRINFEFTYRGGRFALEHSFLRTRLVENLKPGAQVCVLIDPDNLRGSFIKDLYLN